MELSEVRILQNSGKTSPEKVRKFGPKQHDHPSIGKECLACHVPFKAGDFTTLITLGPGDDPEARARAKEDRFYSAVAVEIHWECAGGDGS